MKVRFFSASIVAVAMASQAWAYTEIVNENFDLYADTSAMEAVWSPDEGSGYQPMAGVAGLSVPDSLIGVPEPYDDPPGIEGRGAAFLNNINEYNGPDPGDLLANLVPSATESIRLTGDIFDDADIGTTGKRASIGLRNDTVNRGEFGLNGYNFVELGFYNAGTIDPTDPDSAALPNTQYAYRVTLWGGVSGDLVREPNWQYFPLELVLDVAGIPGGDADFDSDTDQDGNDFLIWQRGNGLTDQTDKNMGDANEDGNVDSGDLWIWQGQFSKPSGQTGDGLVNHLDIGEGWHQYSATITPTTVTLTLDLYRDGLVNTEPTAGVGTVAGVDSTVTWEIVPHNDPTEPNPYDPFNSLRFGGPSGITGNIPSVVDNIKLELIDVDPALAAVPEPGALGLALLALAGLALGARRSD